MSVWRTRFEPGRHPRDQCPVAQAHPNPFVRNSGTTVRLSGWWSKTGQNHQTDNPDLTLTRKGTALNQTPMQASRALEDHIFPQSGLHRPRIVAGLCARRVGQPGPHRHRRRARPVGRAHHGPAVRPAACGWPVRRSAQPLSRLGSHTLQHRLRRWGVVDQPHRFTHGGVCR